MIWYILWEFPFSSVSILPPTLHTYFRLHSLLTRNAAKGRRIQAFRNRCSSGYGAALDIKELSVPSIIKGLKLRFEVDPRLVDPTPAANKLHQYTNLTGSVTLETCTFYRVLESFFRGGDSPYFLSEQVLPRGAYSLLDSPQCYHRKSELKGYRSWLSSKRDGFESCCGNRHQDAS